MMIQNIFSLILSKRLWQYLGITAMTVWFITACGEPTLEHAARGINASPAVWKASKSGKTIYLFGSIHTLPPQIRWYTPLLQSIFAHSDVLVVESLQKNEQSTNPLFVKYAFLPKGKVIKAYLTPLEYQRYLEIAKAAKIDRYYADRMRPWFFMASVHAKITEPFRAYGVDKLFIDAATMQGKEIIALENSREIFQTIAAIPLNEDLTNLKRILADKPTDQSKKAQAEQNHRNAEMLIAWAIGDVDRLTSLFMQSITYGNYRQLIVARNKQWFMRIRRLHVRYNKMLIVVGAGHLIGKSGLLAMLRRNGFKVERIE